MRRYSLATRTDLTLETLKCQKVFFILAFTGSGYGFARLTCGRARGWAFTAVGLRPVTIRRTPQHKRRVAASSKSTHRRTSSPPNLLEHYAAAAVHSANRVRMLASNMR